jgi:hypothetical protein
MRCRLWTRGTPSLASFAESKYVQDDTSSRGLGCRENERNERKTAGDCPHFCAGTIAPMVGGAKLGTVPFSQAVL